MDPLFLDALFLHLTNTYVHSLRVVNWREIVSSGTHVFERDNRTVFISSAWPSFFLQTQEIVLVANATQSGDRTGYDIYASFYYSDEVVRESVYSTCNGLLRTPRSSMEYSHLSATMFEFRPTIMLSLSKATISSFPDGVLPIFRRFLNLITIGLKYVAIDYEIRPTFSPGALTVYTNDSKIRIGVRPTIVHLKVDGLGLAKGVVGPESFDITMRTPLVTITMKYPLRQLKRTERVTAIFTDSPDSFVELTKQ